MKTKSELLDMTAAALVALTSLFVLWTVGVLGFAMLVQGNMESSEAMVTILISIGITALALCGAWALRRMARLIEAQSTDMRASSGATDSSV